ncbi:MAG TPA: TonB-dependent receptor [Puia sp.]|nr:TonB-dependent receptor [Puia sp.]
MRLLLLLSSFVLLFGQLSAQTRTITGKVTDAEGKPIPNVTVLTKGSSRGTTTGEDGTFSLSVAPTAKSLVFSAIGMGTTDVKIGSGNTVNVSLKTGVNKDLQEVVVVGYGTTKKSDLTASVTKISGESVANIPFSSVDQALQGKAAGVQSSGFSGQPGANQQVRIRGISSYAASTQPLYVVDGIQINSGDLARVVASSNVLSNINPDDIESISVLKDAAATSIYGSRGGNGVIVITTKRGRAGKTTFSASAEVGNNKLGNIPKAAKPLNSKDWLALFQESYINAGQTPAAAATAAATYGDGTVDIDWLKTVTRSGQQQQYNLAAQGGEGKTTFYVSGGYFKQQASTIGADLTRISTLVKVENNPSPKLNISLSLQPTYTKENGPLSNGSQFGNPILGAFFLRPTQNPYNADGTLNISTAPKDFQSVFNPLYIAANNIHNLGTFSGIGNAQARYNILDNLKFTTKMGIQYQTLNELQFDNFLHGDGVAAHGRGFTYYTQFFLSDFTNQLDYHFNLLPNKDLVVDAKVGYEAIVSHNYNITAAAQNYPTSRLDLTTIAGTPTNGVAIENDYSFASVFSNVTLNYKDRYVLSGNFRRDGSSRFSPDHKYGNFPAVGFAWNVSKEDFMSNVNAISSLKLRASYGSSGNAEIGNYTFFQLLGYGATLNYNNQPGGGFNSIGNPQLTWEKDKQFDIGTDVSFFSNKLNIVFDYYNKVSSDLLFSYPLSLTSGFGSILENVGKLSNKGVEFTVNATPVASKNFSWDVSFNITHNVNKIETLPPGQTQVLVSQFQVAPGQDINTWYMRQWAGVNPANGDPLWYTDATKKAVTNSYNAAARVNTGKSANPKYYGGFSNTFTYKGFSLAADLYYNYGNYVWDQWSSFLADETNPSYGKYSLTKQRWTTPGQIADVPKLIYGSSNSSNAASTRFLESADYIRLRNVTFGYSLPVATAKRLHMSSLRIYVRGTNLWTSTRQKNLTIDPEQGGSTNINGTVTNGGTTTTTNQGINNLNVFYSKALTAGVSIGF